MLQGRTLWELVERRAEATPDALMLLDEEGRTLTFEGYRQAAERVGAGFAARGVRAGDVVSWQLPTWNETVVLAAALARIGAVQNPLLPIYRQREVAFITRQAGSRLLVVPDTWRGTDFAGMATDVASSVEGLDVLVCGRALPEGDPANLPAPPEPAAADDLPVRWLYYTSGTTAEPKGVMHTDTTVAAGGYGLAAGLEVRADDRTANVFPFTHVGGLVWLTAALMTGCAQLNVEAFDARTTPPFLGANGVTIAGAGTAFHLAYLAAQRERPDEPLFPDVRIFTSGAAPKPPRLHYEVKEVFGVPILSAYGLTEAPIVSCARPDDPDEVLAVSEGHPTPGVTFRVVDGELRVRGPQLFRGYVDRSLEEGAFDEEGFFRTGDLGHLDPSNSVVVTGRLKDVIIRKGENISAKELEDLLFGHPKVADVAVVGLPDPASGERACAVVAPADAAHPPTLDELCGFLRDQGLMAQKLPEQLEVVDALPRNAAGKVLKHELRDRYTP